MTIRVGMAATSAVILIALSLFGFPGHGFAASPQTIVVSAEGLVDANADMYKRDKGLMLDDLREDAKRQAIEKAVGVYVESSTLMQNYQLIHDRVLTKTGGLIKGIIKESPPWVGKDGFAHMLLKAEVYVSGIQDALKEMSRSERVSLIKEAGDPKISVAIMIRDAERGSLIVAERTPVAENILKERIKSFGYRVWSEEATEKLKMELIDRSVLANQSETTVSVAQLKAADFTIIGEVKFKTLKHTLSASGVTVQKYVLTSWSVKCVDNHTGEEIYFNSKIPKKQSWPDEDAAIEDIGQMIGAEFSREFFEEHLQKPTAVYQLQVLGLPSYDVGEMLKKEFIGLRPILNVDLRSFDESALSVYEVEFGGKQNNFNQFLNEAIVKPLNSKLGENCFKLVSSHGNVIRLSFQSRTNTGSIMTKLEEMPPASVATASPQRLQEIVKNDETRAKVELVAEQAKSASSEGEIRSAGDARSIAKDF